ncbi:hypothetical protein [Kitasatospora phosalacinea]|uniref:hypothetical protein n=1 Tax=Kitasatospora phosalacinea TaxID=2065 RepID=UPI0005254034|nr:hypothetical protein [Kitasatospora phosalacinea]
MQFSHKLTDLFSKPRAAAGLAASVVVLALGATAPASTTGLTRADGDTGVTAVEDVTTTVVQNDDLAWG